MNQEYLKSILHYNSEIGIFTWLIAPKRTQLKIGDVARGLCKSTGYIQIKLNGKRYLAHRLAWLYMFGNFPSNDIDHINHNRSDNRIVNLRCVTRQENMQNRTMQNNNVSGFTGVCWHKHSNKWRAYIKIDGKMKELGLFTNLADAITVRQLENFKNNFHYNHGIK